MPSQKWRKKSEHSRKNATFADCFERKMNGLLRSSQRRKATTKKSRVPKSRVKQQLNNSTVNN